jgi:thymidine kinase
MGYLKIIIGPMFSGKTSMLINLYNEQKITTQDMLELYHIKENENNILAINYDKDTRYGINKIVSHDRKEIDCVSVNDLQELTHNQADKDKLESANFLFINEAQFFPNLKNWVLTQVEVFDKVITLCGLDSDYKREKFGEILDLVPHADELIKLYGKCAKCTNKSLFTHRISNETKQEVIGTDNYIPVCRHCYNSSLKS